MHKTLTIKITPVLSGRKIHSILEHEENLSRTIIKRLKKTNKSVLIGESEARLNDRVKEGDILTVTIEDCESSKIEESNRELHILYEDEDIIAVNKEGDMPVHPSRNHKNDTLLNALAHYYKNSFTPHIITRLDRETSGVVLIAKNAVSAKKLTEAMVNKEIEKEYIAVAEGTPKAFEGVINAPIRRVAEGEVLREVSPLGKEAVTKYEIVKTDGVISLVKLVPKTGRTHQIRVHLSYLGIPVYSDGLYGVKRDTRCLLHCKCLTFTHPETGEELVIEAPLFEDMKNVLKIINEDDIIVL